LRERLKEDAVRSVFCALIALLGGALWGPAPAEEKAPRLELLIVAPARFRHALGTYATHKGAQLPTRVVDLEGILGRTEGFDDPERLKRYLHAEWSDGGAASPQGTPGGRRLYVLLVGDADSLPVRYMVLDRITKPAYDYAFYPSDLYYADLAKADGSFEGWNGRKDGFHRGYFGEVRGEKNKEDPINFDGIHYLPEAAVGRWPASTPEEVATIAAKSMSDELGVLGGKKPGARRAAFVAVGGWVDARGIMDRLAARLPEGWSAERRYYRGGRWGTETAPPSAEEVIGLLNAGAGLVCHAGHGQDADWESSFGLRHLGRLQNADRLPIVISVGCSTARFATLPPYEAYVDVEGGEHAGTDRGEVFAGPPPPPAPYQRGKHNPTGLGEGLLRRGPEGAVAYIGCNTGSQPCGLSLLEGFVLGLRDLERPRLGDAWSHAIAHYHEKERLSEIEPTESWYPASIYFQGMKFMLFGDPSLVVPIP
jgi:hypothetical protein